MAWRQALSNVLCARLSPSGERSVESTGFQDLMHKRLEGEHSFCAEFEAAACALSML